MVAEVLNRAEVPLRRLPHHGEVLVASNNELAWLILIHASVIMISLYMCVCVCICYTQCPPLLGVLHSSYVCFLFSVAMFHIGLTIGTYCTGNGQFYTWHLIHVIFFFCNVLRNVRFTRMDERSKRMIHKCMRKLLVKLLGIDIFYCLWKGWKSTRMCLHLSSLQMEKVWKMRREFEGQSYRPHSCFLFLHAWVPLHMSSLQMERRELSRDNLAGSWVQLVFLHI